MAAIVLGCVAYVAQPGSALAPSTEDDLSTASLEKLTQMEISVSSFARKEEDLWKTPAAVFVITRRDIQRSAATSIPELLRMVPGMQVAQIDASAWAVSARGFNNAYANKLLILVDGRTVYSEVYDGVHWDEFDLPMEDIERIEVIRGPGAAVWGTNAVNGVVNIITRRARSTAGLTSSTRIGRLDAMTNLQYGGTLGDLIQYRGFANYIDRAPFELADGRRAFDGEETVRGGGRVDWQQSQTNWLSLSGDLYGGHLQQQLTAGTAIPVEPNKQELGSISGGYLLSRWEHKLRHADSALQVFFDDSRRHELANYGRYRTFDAEFQDHLVLGRRHDLVWGTQFRLTSDHIVGLVPVTMKPDYRNYLVDGFVQDEISLIPSRLVVTLGSKIQDGTLAGVQIQPSVRVLWSPASTQTVWGAVSRAVVAPSIQDIAIRIPLALGTYPTPLGELPISATLQGNPAFTPETVLAYEAGYRRRIGASFTLDLASFIDVTHHLATLYQSVPQFVPLPVPHVSTTLLYTNAYNAKSTGLEAGASWLPTAALSLRASYAWMQARTHQTEPGSFGLIDSWNTPRNTIAASGSWSFAPHWGLNAFLYHADGVPSNTTLLLSPKLVSSAPPYTRLDIHLTRRVGRSTELDAGGTNLLTGRHREFGDGIDVTTASYVPRSLFLNVKWAF